LTQRRGATDPASEILQARCTNFRTHNSATRTAIRHRDRRIASRSAGIDRAGRIIFVAGFTPERRKGGNSSRIADCARRIGLPEKSMTRNRLVASAAAA
jgi:hypothetical protein